jgi:hypothetical protein
MPDVKITELPVVTTVLGSDILPVVASNTTSQITVADLANSIASTGITGSLIMSGSIIPVVGSGSATSSFSLGSATNAWNDLWISNGTVYFLNGAGAVESTLSSTAAGMSMNSLTIRPEPGAYDGNAIINLNASANNSSFVNYTAGGVKRFSAGSDSNFNYRINSYTGDTFHGVAVLVPTGSTRVLIGGTFDDGTNALQVNGAARIQTDIQVTGSAILYPQGQPSPQEGLMYFDTNTKEFKGYNGSAWVVLG